MNPPLNLDDYTYTEDQLEALREARELQDMRKTAGWLRVQAFMQGLVDVARDQAEAANTSNPIHAIDLLREWQNKADFLKQITLHIESSIAKADELAPRNQLESLLLEEGMYVRSSAPNATGSNGT